MSPEQHSELLIRIDERLKNIHNDFNEYKIETTKRLALVEQKLEDNKEDIRNFKTGFSVVTAIAGIGAMVIFQWEQIKAFFKGTT
jgi:archaellum component FlaC